jgi:hypothetical protein
MAAHGFQPEGSVMLRSIFPSGSRSFFKGSSLILGTAGLLLALGEISRADSLPVSIDNLSQFEIRIQFYSQSYANRMWPVTTLPANRLQQFSLDCVRGERICYNARTWPQPAASWGGPGTCAVCGMGAGPILLSVAASPYDPPPPPSAGVAPSDPAAMSNLVQRGMMQQYNSFQTLQRAMSNY